MKKNFKKLPGGTSVHIANESDDDESEEDIDDVFDLAQEEIEEQVMEVSRMLLIDLFMIYMN